jgi:signal transduction histidine kinase
MRNELETKLEVSFDLFAQTNNCRFEPEQCRQRSKEFGARLAEREQKLRQTERLASIGQTMTHVAHELRNTLQNMRLSVDILRAEIRGDLSETEALDQIDKGIQQMSLMAAEILDYTKPSDLCYCAVTTSRLIQEALKAAAYHLRDISVSIHLDGGDEEIHVDFPRLTSVLVNLFSNAAEAMPSGGEMTIRSGFLEPQGEKLLRLTVSDTGCGIPEENLERIFEPFVTTKPHGVGLGLSISKKIVENHAGTISVTSAVDEGTTVEIVIPCRNRLVAAAPLPS